MASPGVSMAGTLSPRNLSSSLLKLSWTVLAQLKAHWYEWGSGSEGAQHALDEFQRKYDHLLSTGDKKGAEDLLAGTLASGGKVSIRLSWQTKCFVDALRNARTTRT